jgi:hypothetical protein
MLQTPITFMSAETSEKPSHLCKILQGSGVKSPKSLDTARRLHGHFLHPTADELADGFQPQEDCRDTTNSWLTPKAAALAAFA